MRGIVAKNEQNNCTIGCQILIDLSRINIFYRAVPRLYQLTFVLVPKNLEWNEKTKESCYLTINLLQKIVLSQDTTKPFKKH